MSFENQRDQALAILAKTGMWQSNYAPPALKAAWAMGLKVPPPHFARFWPTAAALGTWFGVLWGLVMWFFIWSKQGMPLSGAVIASVVAGGLFGLSMAIYYAYGRRKYKLPSWGSLAEESPRT